MKKSSFVVSIGFLMILLFQAQSVHAQGEDEIIDGDDVFAHRVQPVRAQPSPDEEEFDADKLGPPTKSLTDEQVRAVKLQAKRFKIGSESTEAGVYNFNSSRFAVRTGLKKRYDEIQEILNGLGTHHTVTLKDWDRLVKLVPQIDGYVQQPLVSRPTDAQASISPNPVEKSSQQSIPRRSLPLAISPQSSTTPMSSIHSDRTEKLSISEQDSLNFSPLSSSASSAR